MVRSASSLPPSVSTFVWPKAVSTNDLGCTVRMISIDRRCNASDVMGVSNYACLLVMPGGSR